MRNEGLAPYEVGVTLRTTRLSHQHRERILDLVDEPQMRKAKVIGYAIAQWGDYPTLIDGESGQEILGYAYVVQTEEDAKKLAYYKTKAYEEAPCLI